MPYFQSLYDILGIAKSASADESQLVPYIFAEYLTHEMA